MSNTAPRGNPAVVGLAGFGITTMLLQFHNVGWCGVGPVVSMAFIFGGLAQLTDYRSHVDTNVPAEVRL